MLAGDRGSAPFRLDKADAAQARHLDRRLSGRGAGWNGGSSERGRSCNKSPGRDTAAGLAQFPVSPHGRRCHGSTHPPRVPVGRLHLPARRHGVHEDSSWRAACSLRSISKQYLVGAHRRCLHHELWALIPHRRSRLERRLQHRDANALLAGGLPSGGYPVCEMRSFCNPQPLPGPSAGCGLLDMESLHAINGLATKARKVLCFAIWRRIAGGGPR